MLGAALIISLCLPAAADERPAPVPLPPAHEQAAGPQDEPPESDVTPSAQELRRMRRAERRARRRAGRKASDAAKDADATAAEKSGEAAVQKALTMGEALKGSLKDGSSSGLPDAASARGAMPSAGPVAGNSPAGPARPPADPSQPRTEHELVLAAQSAYRDSPAAVGLKVERDASGAGRLLREDGRPAAPADLEALRRRIAAEPRALMRRPDFFQVLPREHYQELKRDFRGRPELKAAAFQDVGLTPQDRDFVWDRTCQQVSGGCNPNAREGGYKKDSEVAPEDLDSIWRQVYGTADTFLQAVVGRRAAAPDAGPGVVSPSLMGRLLGRLASWRGWFSGEDPGDVLSSEAAAVSAAAGGAAAGGPGRIRSQDSLRAAQAARAARGRKRQAGAGLGLLAAGVLLWLVLRSRP
ncbi:MAG: hypothetical protein NTY77_19100 [Elusimicrobia bacterium]|nr:hypothetical protein [Elusimicrobiota bacterium]